METVLITIAGYALTVVFATTSVILANSLRHRRNELDAANLEAQKQRELAFNRLNLIADARRELKTCRDAATLLKARNQKQEKEITDLTSSAKKLANKLQTAEFKMLGAYKREGKRFVKIS
jgi:hypothetical protein